MGGMSRISRRVGAITESATLAVDAKAKALQAAGEDVIGFGAGEPDFPTPAHIVEAAVAACADPKQPQVHARRRASPSCAPRSRRRPPATPGYEVEPSQVVVTNGGKHAVYNAFQTLLDPGDEVILPAPYWTTYPEAIALADGVPVEVLAPESAGFRVTVDQLEAARTPRTKVRALRVAEQPHRRGLPARRGGGDRSLGGRARHLGAHRRDLRAPHVRRTTSSRRCRSSCPSSPTRCVVLNGVAKTYAMTGWRVGWMIGPADFTAAAINLQSHQTSNVPNVSQRAALAAVSGNLDAVAEMRAAFDRRGRLMHELLAAIPGVTCLEPQGAFYCFPSFEGVLGRDSRAARPRPRSSCAS